MKIIEMRSLMANGFERLGASANQSCFVECGFDEDRAWTSMRSPFSQNRRCTGSGSRKCRRVCFPAGEKHEETRRFINVWLSAAMKLSRSKRRSLLVPEKKLAMSRLLPLRMSIYDCSRRFLTFSQLSNCGSGSRRRSSSSFLCQSGSAEVRSRHANGFPQGLGEFSFTSSGMASISGLGQFHGGGFVWP